MWIADLLKSIPIVDKWLERWRLKKAKARHERDLAEFTKALNAKDVEQLSQKIGESLSE